MQDIVAQKETGFHLVPFDSFRKSHQGYYFKSKQYEKYFVLCYINTMFHTGWMLFPYVRNGFCAVSKGLFEIDTRKGGTNRFGRHMMEHERTSRTTVSIPQNLATRCRQDIARAAALAVVLNLRPLGFADNKEGMSAYAEAVFRAGQSVPHGVSINNNSYLPCRSTVKNSVADLARQLRETFASRISTELNSLGGAITIDGLTLKLQGRHY